MRLIHIGDLQIGPTRFAQKQRALDSIIASLDDRKVRADVAVIAGDLFDEGHRGTPADPTSRNAVAEFVNDLRKYAEHIIIVRGNHDACDPATGACDLDYLKNYGAFIATERPLEWFCPEGYFYIMPYPSKTTIARDGDSTARGSAALDVILKSWSKAPRHNRPVVYVGHHNVAGSTTESGQPLIGREVEIGADTLAALRADYYALGHIHRPQPLPGQDALPHAPLGARGGYAGSIAPCDFGETTPKGFAIVDLAVGREPVIEWVPIDNDRLVTITGTFIDPIGFMWSFEPSEPTKHHQIGDMPECFRLDHTEVKLRYTVAERHATKALADRAVNEAAFLAHGATSVVWESKVITATAVRSGAAEVCRALSLAEKIDATWKAQGALAPSAEVQARALAMLGEIGGAS